MTLKSMLPLNIILEASSLMDDKIKNPVTGRMIKVGSALSYGKDTAVYKLAKKYIEDKDKKASAPTKQTDAPKQSSEPQSDISTEDAYGMLPKVTGEHKKGDIRKVAEKLAATTMTTKDLDVESRRNALARTGEYNKIYSSFGQSHKTPPYEGSPSLQKSVGALADRLKSSTSDHYVEKGKALEAAYEKYAKFHALDKVYSEAVKLRGDYEAPKQARPDGY